jgi:hypothetical protein
MGTRRITELSISVFTLPLPLAAASSSASGFTVPCCTGRNWLGSSPAKAVPNMRFGGCEPPRGSKPNPSTTRECAMASART